MEEKNRTGGSEDTIALLSVFHYVLGGLQYLASLLGLFYLVMGIALGSGELESAKNSAPPEAVGWIFGGIGVVIIILALVMGTITIRAGKCIRKRKNRMFCLVVDTILCVFLPFGTIVGIFGLVMLTRPEIRDQFTA